MVAGYLDIEVLLEGHFGFQIYTCTSRGLTYCAFGFFFFQAEDGIRDRSPSRGLGDVYKRQGLSRPEFQKETWQIHRLDSTDNSA